MSENNKDSATDVSNPANPPATANGSLNIPKYVSNVPWYVNKDKNGSMDHQKKISTDEKVSDINVTYERSRYIGQATKYRKGACKNCGSMSHTEKDCFYAPRKRGAWKTNKDIKPDEYVNKEINFSYDAKRDRWNGVDASAVLERSRHVFEEAEKKKLLEHAKELNDKFQTEPDPDHKRFYSSTVTREQKKREKLVDDGEQLDVHISSSDSDSGDSVEDIDAEDASKKNVQYDPHVKTSARDMRIREDIAYYLKDLSGDPNNYDPRASRLSNLSGNMVPASDEADDFKEAQRLVWEASAHNTKVHLEAQPTAAALLRKQVNERKQQAEEHKRKMEEERKKRLEKKYNTHISEEKKQNIEVIENYVEYDREGNVVRGFEEAIPSSKYQEDVYPGNHHSVWGSWYDRDTHKWGYACCHQCIRNAYCTED